MAMVGPSATATAMTDAGLLTLAQWLSPAFPLGSFAYSQGLETAMVEGHVRDAETLRIWLDDILTHGAGQTDAILLTQARQAEEGLDLSG